MSSDRGSIMVALENLADLLCQLEPRTAEAICGLAETAAKVCVLHKDDARGAEAWVKQAPHEHVQHAHDHLVGWSFADDDGMSEASHAAARIAFLLSLKPELRS